MTSPEYGTKEYYRSYIGLFTHPDDVENALIISALRNAVEGKGLDYARNLLAVIDERRAEDE